MDGNQIKSVWLRQTIFIPVFFALLLAPAWSLNYWQAWVYGIVFFATTTAIGIYFLKRDPRVIERRMRVGPTAERKPAQKIIMTLLLAGFVLLLVVPGFDHRWSLSRVPPWLVLTADAFRRSGLVRHGGRAQAKQLCGVHHHCRSRPAGHLHRTLCDCPPSDVQRRARHDCLHTVGARLGLGPAPRHPADSRAGVAAAQRGTFPGA